jgi:hypothetical protein
MAPSPFLSLKVRGKKDVLALRQKARLVAHLLSFDAFEQTCIAAGAFAVACRALGQLGKAQIDFLIDEQQLHVFARRPEGDTAERTLLRLTKPLPREKGLSEMDVAWLVTSLDLASHGSLFDEIAKQNQEVLTLLHELHANRGYVGPQEEKPKNPNAA